MTVAIKVENLSKKYLIQHEKKSAHYETFSESIIQTGKNVVDRIRSPWGSGVIDQSSEEEFWALKDINFEINQGDKVGIIGRNGAGKSTLLKVLSRITEPTTGKIHINGRIASLLEVGTGFHPELTGRENIFLNGAILGMSRKEIKAKFDEIVAFAEVEKFLDTPVKRYSSGMYVRLAFAVAAHLESEILVVDEVLAVGDAEFQKKSLGKMKEFGEQGRTVLFVSHNFDHLMNVCDRGLLLNAGGLQYSSGFEEVLTSYTSLLSDSVQSFYRGDEGHDLIKGVEISEYKNNKGVIKTGDALEINIHFNSGDYELDYAGVGINDFSGRRLLTSKNYFDRDCQKKFPKKGVIKCKIHSLQLTAGIYYIDVALGTKLNGFLDRVNNCMSFEVLFANYFATGEKLHDGEGVSVIKASWVV